MVNARTRLELIVRAAAAWPARSQAQAGPGTPLPSLAAAGLGGGTLPETAGREVLVDSWAPWCAPCRASLPAYSRLRAAYAARGLAVIAIGVDENPSAHEACVARLKPAFATPHDSRQKLAGLVRVPTTPASYPVDRGGRLRFVNPGFHGGQTEREIRREAGPLLDEKPMRP